jgi:hypothetical protein
MKKRIFAMLAAVCTVPVLHIAVHAEEKRYSDEEYSTIKTDGQIVPVGERHRYRLAYDTWNIWTNPFGYFFGSFNIGASYAFHQNFKVNLEPRYIYFFAASPKVVGGGATASVSIFFKKVYDGFYLEPGASILYISQKRRAGSNEIDGFVGGPQLIGGWGWKWDSGFNINLGMGLGYFWGKVGRDVEDTEAFEGVLPVANLQIGFTF